MYFRQSTIIFEDGSVDAVLAALGPYQNNDGSFAHSLEPDLRTSALFAIATTVGFQILREIQASVSHINVTLSSNLFFCTTEDQRKMPLNLYDH